VNFSQELIRQIDEFFGLPKIHKLLNQYGWGDTGMGYLVHPALPKHRIRVGIRGVTHIKADATTQEVSHKSVAEYLKQLHHTTFRKLSKGAYQWA
jgi:hypothetical protein